MYMYVYSSPSTIAATAGYTTLFSNNTVDGMHRLCLVGRGGSKW